MIDTDLAKRVEAARRKAGGLPWGVVAVMTNQAADWLAGGEDNELVYMVGSAFSLTEFRHADRNLNELAYWLAKQSTNDKCAGKIALVQRRRDAGHFEYVAIRTKPRRFLTDDTPKQRASA